MGQVTSMTGFALRTKRRTYSISSMQYVSHSKTELFFQDEGVLISSQSNGLLDLYTWEEVCQVLHMETRHNKHDGSSTSQGPRTLDSAALYLMVAIGAQCYGPTKDAVVWAAELFSYARKLAFAQMLESPSLDLVRVFLLMAFYMFGACRRNSAFMYLGIASKSADILGLHMSAQQKHTVAQTQNAK
jgi:hypothetical protein